MVPRHYTFEMSNSVQDPKQEELQNADTPMESPEKAQKGKGKMAEEVAMGDDESESDEEASGVSGRLISPSQND